MEPPPLIISLLTGGEKTSCFLYNSRLKTHNSTLAVKDRITVP